MPRKDNSTKPEELNGSSNDVTATQPMQFSAKPADLSASCTKIFASWNALIETDQAGLREMSVGDIQLLTESFQVDNGGYMSSERVSQTALALVELLKNLVGVNDFSNKLAKAGFNAVKAKL